MGNQLLFFQPTAERSWAFCIGEVAMKPEHSGTDILFALAFIACVVAGTWWLITILNDRFAAALAAEFLALARDQR